MCFGVMSISAYVPDVGVIIGRWLVFRQVRGLRRPQLPSEHFVTESSSEGDIVLRTGHGHYYTYVSALLFSYYVVHYYDWIQIKACGLGGKGNMWGLAG